MKKNMWRRAFTPTTIPKYPCPRCKDGHLVLDGKVAERQPAWSSLQQKHEHAELIDIVERFHFVMICGNKVCGEIVSVIGTSGPEPDYDDDYGQVYVPTLRPDAIFPAPPMIEVPTKTPQKALDHLKKAFHVCWTDTNAAANCLRVSVEYLLDDLEIPRARKNKNDEDVDLDLNARIQIVEQSDKISGHASTFHALRIVGNLGSHGNGVKWDNLLDGFLVYEKALADLLGNEGAVFEEAKARLLSLKKLKPKKQMLPKAPEPSG